MYTSVLCGIIQGKLILQEYKVNQEVDISRYTVSTSDDAVYCKRKDSEDTEGMYLEFVRETADEPVLPNFILDILETLYVDTDLESNPEYDVLVSTLTTRYLTYGKLDSHEMGRLSTVCSEGEFRCTCLVGDEPYYVMKKPGEVYEVVVEYDKGIERVKILYNSKVILNHILDTGNVTKVYKYIKLCRLYAKLGLRIE